MALFLTDDERQQVSAGCGQAPLHRYYWALLNRAGARAADPAARDEASDCEWWHHTAEYLTDGAMAWALKPTDQLAAWVRAVTLAVARRPVDDWVGPWFRNHHEPKTGHLETAHLAWSVAVALDLCEPVFTAAEAEELREVLATRAIPLCRRWLEHNQHLANWRCVLNAGVALPAAVLGDREALAAAKAEFEIDCQTFQPDGSNGESLQYGNYAAYTCALTCEALLRSGYCTPAEANPARYLGYARWAAHSLFYCKPLDGWGQAPRPRSANFNDCGAITAPIPDLLLHLASRGAAIDPTAAALARWLTDTVYEPTVGQGPHHRSTFGFVNRFGFLTIPLLPAAVAGQSPAELGEPELAAFSCGDVLARDHWAGRTILAVHGGGDPLCGPGHLHGDLNSFILVHNRERLLVDPGHSCYRGLVHRLEVETATHNTCTFEVKASAAALQEEVRGGLLQQSCSGRRPLVNGQLGAPADRGARRLLVARDGDLTVIASEAAALYGPPLTEFTRVWLLCGSHALFVVDRIRASLPVTTRWQWLLNNRDETLEVKVLPPDRLVARRGDAGMKLFCLAPAQLDQCQHAFVHDAYHPLPGKLGEGRSGSGLLVPWRSTTAATEVLATHAIAADDYGAIAGWHLRDAAGQPALEAPGGAACWQLAVGDGSALSVTESVSGTRWTVAAGPDWSLTRT